MRVCVRARAQGWGGGVYSREGGLQPAPALFVRFSHPLLSDSDLNLILCSQGLQRQRSLRLGKSPHLLHCHPLLPCSASYKPRSVKRGWHRVKPESPQKHFASTAQPLLHPQPGRVASDCPTPSTQAQWSRSWNGCSPPPLDSWQPSKDPAGGHKARLHSLGWEIGSLGSVPIPFPSLCDFGQGFPLLGSLI